MTAAPAQLHEIQLAFKTWAFENFGDNEAKHGYAMGCALGPLAPLMGMCEEVGELLEAHHAKDAEKTLDALADIGIYLMDYSNRAGVVLSAITVAPSAVSDHLRGGHPVQQLGIYLGRLQRAHLKQAQGIRNHGQDDVFRATQMEAVAGLFVALHLLAWDMFRKTFMEVLVPVANEVLKRDWITNPNTAHETAAVS